MELEGERLRTGPLLEYPLFLLALPATITEECASAKGDCSGDRALWLGFAGGGAGGGSVRLEMNRGWRKEEVGWVGGRWEVGEGLSFSHPHPHPCTQTHTPEARQKGECWLGAQERGRGEGEEEADVDAADAKMLKSLASSL